MNKREIRAMRRPFIKELFRNNRFNMTMTVLAALFGAAAELVISWLISIARLHDHSNVDVAEASKKRTKVNVLVSYSSGIAGAVLQFVVFFVAAALALSGKGITAGTAIVFVQLLNYVLGPIQAFPTFFAGMMSACGLIDKLALALNKNVSDDGGQIPPHLTGGISVKDLAFAYEE